MLPIQGPIALSDLPGQISLSSLSAVLWQRRWYILGAAVFAVALGYVFLLLIDPHYEVQARLMVEQQGALLEQGAADPRGDKDFLGTQAEVIRSPAVVRRAVEARGLVVATEPDADPATAILEQLRVAPVLGTHVLSVKYESTDADEAQRIVSAVIATYQEYLHSHEANSQVETVRLLTRTEEDLRKDLARREAERLKLREQSSLLGGQGRDALAVQIGQLTKLGESVQVLTSRRYELANLLEAMEKANALADAASSGDVHLTAYRGPRDATSDGAPTAVSNSSPEMRGLIPRFIQQSAMPRDLVTIQDELSKAIANQQQLYAQYGAKHPDVQAAHAQVAAWEDRLNSYVHAAPTTLKQELDALARQEKQMHELYEAELAKAKTLDVDLVKEQQALDGIARLQAMHTTLLNQLQQVQLTEQAVAEGRSRIVVRVLEDPAPPEDPTWPVPKLVLAISLALGLVSGIAVAFLLGPKTPRCSQVALALHGPAGVLPVGAV